MGVVFYKLGKYDEAIECYDKALAADPKYILAFNNKEVAVSKLKEKTVKNILQQARNTNVAGDLMAIEVTAQAKTKKALPSSIHGLDKRLPKNSPKISEKKKSRISSKIESKARRANKKGVENRKVRGKGMSRAGKNKVNRQKKKTNKTIR